MKIHKKGDFSWHGEATFDFIISDIGTEKYSSPMSFWLQYSEKIEKQFTELIDNAYEEYEGIELASFHLWPSESNDSLQLYISVTGFFDKTTADDFSLTILEPGLVNIKAGDNLFRTP